MRLSVPASLIGTLGSLAQRAIGAVNALVATIWPFSYGASFASTTNSTANTAVQVVAPASNVNGLIVWSAQFATVNATGLARAAFIAKASAPASNIDGDPIVANDNGITISTQFWGFGALFMPVLVPAGKGLYYITDTTETATYKSVLYTTL